MKYINQGYFLTIAYDLIMHISGKYLKIIKYIKILEL